MAIPVTSVTDAQIVTITRTFTPIWLTHMQSDGWSYEPFTMLVWRGERGHHEAYAPRTPSTNAPVEYMPGLLHPYVNGKPISIPELDDVLQKMGLTRDGVMRQINEAKPGGHTLGSD